MFFLSNVFVHIEHSSLSASFLLFSQGHFVHQILLFDPTYSDSPRLGYWELATGTGCQFGPLSSGRGRGGNLSSGRKSVLEKRLRQVIRWRWEIGLREKCLHLATYICLQKRYSVAPTKVLHAIPAQCKNMHKIIGKTQILLLFLKIQPPFPSQSSTTNNNNPKLLWCNPR